MRLGSGKGQEIDVVGAAGPEKWVCEGKWAKGRKAGIAEIEGLISKAELVREEMEPLVVRMWLFAYDGLTNEAEEFARQKGVFWSSRSELDELLAHVGLRPLPDV